MAKLMIRVSQMAFALVNAQQGSTGLNSQSLALGFFRPFCLFDIPLSGEMLELPRRRADCAQNLKPVLQTQDAPDQELALCTRRVYVMGLLLRGGPIIISAVGRAS